MGAEHIEQPPDRSRWRRKAPENGDGRQRDPATSEREPPRRKTPWRDNVEALVVAVVMAVFLKYFIVEAYKIPTGSMQPTLMGQALGKGGGVFDRILVDKLSYHFRDPQRWEVAVFKYPLDRSKNFVKRIWGLPGEELRIQHGDVWTRPDGSAPWQVLRRPRSVQEETWKALDLGARDELPSWAVERGSWTAGDRSLSARGAGRARFAAHGGGSIQDRYLDGYPITIRDEISPRHGTGNQAVGDLRVGGRVRALMGCELVVLELAEGGRRYRFELPGPAAAADARPRVALAGEDGRAPGGGVQAVGEPYRLPAGRWVRFGAQNLDDLLELELDGERVAELEIAPTAVQHSAVAIEVQGEGADLDGLQVWRDIYYLPANRGEHEWQVDPGHYFMLGDNTQDSSDSREWALVNLRWSGPGAPEGVVRGNSRPRNPGLSPLETNPWREVTLEGRTTWFRDEWGEPYVFPSSAEEPLPPDEVMTPAPFVPRELITGRALLVFWPISVRRRLWRLRWIH